MRPFSLSAFLILLFISVSLFSQDSETSESDEMMNLDDLFTSPAEDIVVEDVQMDNRSQFEESEKIKFSGDFNAVAGVGAGWTNLSFFNDVTDGFDPSVGLAADFTVNLDIRPIPELKLYASVFTEFDPYALLDDDDDDSDGNTTTDSLWTTPDFESLYCDYIFADSLYTRFGIFTTAWGQGRFYTPGDLMSDSSNSTMNFRFTLPNLSGLSLVLLSNDSTSYEDFTYGGKTDFVFGETMVSPGVTYNSNDGLHTLLSFKQVLFKTDFLIDFTTNIKSEHLESLYIVTGFYHKWSDITLYGEYQFSWFDSEYDHEVSLAAKWRKPFGVSFDAGVQFMQNFTDGSGTVTLGITQKIFPLVEMKVALPIVYGEEGSSAVENNEDSSGRRVYLAAGLYLSTSF